jgi:hypothetical protein
MADWSRNLIPPPLFRCTPSERFFVSSCHLNQLEAETFGWTWRNVFTARALAMAHIENMIDSDNPAYVANPTKLHRWMRCTVGAKEVA